MRLRLSSPLPFALTATVVAALSIGRQAVAQEAASAPLAASAPAAATAATNGDAALAADTPSATPAGATFTAPTGWALHAAPTFVVVQPPEADSRIVLVDVPSGTAAEAVAAAWATVRPDKHLVLKLATPLPARNGWDEIQAFAYETSPNDRLVVQARALRHGTAWTILLQDGTEPTFEKRLAAAGQVVQSLRPRGYKRESFAGRKPHDLDAARVAQIQDFVRTAMKELQIPGVSIALTEGDKVVFEGGFGVRELGKPAKVDANTLFMAASNTKGMTTLLLAQLVDEGKLQWKEPVVDVFPAFKLGDPDVTRQVLVENLVCACTGLPRQDLEWIFEFKHATPETSMALLGTMKPTSKFGEVFQYSNLMASAAGYIGGHLVYPDLELGAAYDKAMRKRVFDPLGMRSTTFDMATALRSDHASPHSWGIDGRVGVAPMAFNYAVMPHRPAGGVWTSSHDLIRYVQLELSQGVLPDGTRLVSAQNLLERRRAGVPVGEDATYGMGLETDRAWGVPVVHHGGSMSGFKSDLIIVPDADIGAVLLTNSDQGQLMLRPFMRRLLEVIYDGKPEAVEDVAARARREAAEDAEERKHLVAPAAHVESAKLAHAYRSPELGDLAVRSDKGETVFDLGEWKTPVASRRNDDGTVSFVSTGYGLIGFEFVVGERGGKRVLLVRDGQHEYVFTEV